MITSLRAKHSGYLGGAAEEAGFLRALRVRPSALRMRRRSRTEPGFRLLGSLPLKHPHQSRIKFGRRSGAKLRERSVAEAALRRIGSHFHFPIRQNPSSTERRAGCYRLMTGTVLKAPLGLNRRAMVDRRLPEASIRNCPEPPLSTGYLSGSENEVVVPAESRMLLVRIS